MKRIAITGTGAVTPAGWGVEAMWDALQEGEALPVESLERSNHGVTISVPVRKVPAGASLKHPRLRRTSPVSKFAVAAAVEALGEERMAECQAGTLRVGILCTLLNGCVQYTNRFFAEVRQDPAMASPILFPETVFNAPSSHLSALLGSTAPNDSLLGDRAGFFTALEVATEWLQRDEVDGVLVIGCEELDWLSAEGIALYDKGLIASEGAGALYLEWSEEGVALEAIDEISLTEEMDQTLAMSVLRERLDHGRQGMLVDGKTGVARWDQEENEAWEGWDGGCISPMILLGESLAAAAAWQAVVAVEAVRRGIVQDAIACIRGGNGQVAGMRVNA